MMIQNARFNLNDITHEPSDEQLNALMDAVATEARQHADTAREQLMIRLRAEIVAIHALSTQTRA